MTHILLLLRLPFLFAGCLLGGCIWWVTRRLYGNLGGYTALALYCFSPAVLKACVAPNPEILAALGVYGGVYTCIGVAHAMQGPRRKWRPRMVLLTLLFGVAAASHIAASAGGGAAGAAAHALGGRGTPEPGAAGGADGNGRSPGAAVCLLRLFAGRLQLRLPLGGGIPVVLSRSGAAVLRRAGQRRNHGGRRAPRWCSTSDSGGRATSATQLRSSAFWSWSCWS